MIFSISRIGNSLTIEQYLYEGLTIDTSFLLLIPFIMTIVAASYSANEADLGTLDIPCGGYRCSVGTSWLGADASIMNIDDSDNAAT